MKISRRQLRQLINEAINEHRIKPELPESIPAAHRAKIESLIDGGELEMARSLIDALGGSADYVDNYLYYSEVGDLEKLGNKASDLIDTIPSVDGMSSMGDMQPVYDIDHQASDMIASKASRGHGNGIDYDATKTHDRRYISNRNRNYIRSGGRPGFYAGDFFIKEHRIKPSITNIPPEHLDKIHSLIDSGEIEQAQAFIDAFDGDPNYARNYKPYSSVGDLEKLGNNTAEMFQKHPENPGFKPGFTRQDAQANYDLATSISRKHAEQFEDPDDGLDAFDTHFYDRYIPNVNKSAATGWDADRFLEHRVEPSHPNRDTIVVESRIRNSIRKMILKEMAVRRILEIDMSDQYYLRAPELPGGEVAVGVEVEDLIDALYAYANESYTHVVMSDDLRDFNRDRSQFRYGIYTRIETAIKMLQIHRDPRRLYIQRS